MTDRFNAGGHREEIPEDFILDGKVDEDSLLDYISVTHTYMDTLSYRRDSVQLCCICKSLSKIHRSKKSITIYCAKYVLKKLIIKTNNSPLLPIAPQAAIADKLDTGNNIKELN